MKKFLMVIAAVLLLASNAQAGGPRGGNGNHGHQLPARQVTIVKQHSGPSYHHTPRSYYHRPRTVYVDNHHHHHGCGHNNLAEISAVFLGAVGGAYILSNIF